MLTWEVGWFQSAKTGRRARKQEEEPADVGGAEEDTLTMDSTPARDVCVTNNNNEQPQKHMLASTEMHVLHCPSIH